MFSLLSPYKEDAMENHFLPSLAEASACAWRCGADLEAQQGAAATSADSCGVVALTSIL